MVDSADTPSEPVRAFSRAARRAEERARELAACSAEITATLDKYEAAVQVIETITYVNGIAHHAHNIQIVGKNP